MRKHALAAIFVAVVAIGIRRLNGVLQEASVTTIDPGLAQVWADFRHVEPPGVNGYFAMLGIGSLEPGGAEVLGRRIAELDAANGKALLDGRPPAELESLGIRWRPAERYGDALCSWKDEGRCAPLVLAHRAHLVRLLADARPMLDEYRALRGYPVFRYPQLPTPDFLSSPRLDLAQGLWRAEIVLLAADGHADEALAELLEDLRFWRRVVNQPHPTLYDTSAAMLAVASDGLTISEFMREGWFGTSQAVRIVRELPPLVTGGVKARHFGGERRVPAT